MRRPYCRQEYQQSQPTNSLRDFGHTALSHYTIIWTHDNCRRQRIKLMSQETMWPNMVGPCIYNKMNLSSILRVACLSHDSLVSRENGLVHQVIPPTALDVDISAGFQQSLSLAQHSSVQQTKKNVTIFAFWLRFMLHRTTHNREWWPWTRRQHYSIIPHSDIMLLITMFTLCGAP